MKCDVMVTCMGQGKNKCQCEQAAHLSQLLSCSARTQQKKGKTKIKIPYLGLGGAVFEQTNERTAILVIFHLLMSNTARKDKYSIKHTMRLLFVCRE